MKLIFIFPIILVMMLISCGVKTTKLSFNGGELLYTDAITADQAAKLGNYLVQSKFYDGKPKTVQIDKKDGLVHFAMVLNDTLAKSAEYQTMGEAFVDELEQAVFNGQTVALDYCDEYLNVRKTISNPKAATGKTSNNETPTLTGAWVCTDISGGNTEPQKAAADLAVLKTNFKFNFNGSDQTFKSDFMNGADVSQPLQVEGFYTVVKDKISFHHLKVNNQPAAEEMVFNFGLNDKQMQLISRTEGVKDLVMTFEKN